jgi:hypothetical protein
MLLAALSSPPVLERPLGAAVGDGRGAGIGAASGAIVGTASALPMPRMRRVISSSNAAGLKPNRTLARES